MRTRYQVCIYFAVHGPQAVPWTDPQTDPHESKKSRKSTNKSHFLVYTSMCPPEKPRLVLSSNRWPFRTQIPIEREQPKIEQKRHFLRVVDNCPRRTQEVFGPATDGPSLFAEKSMNPRHRNTLHGEQTYRRDHIGFYHQLPCFVEIRNIPCTQNKTHRQDSASLPTAENKTHGPDNASAN